MKFPNRLSKRKMRSIKRLSVLIAGAYAMAPTNSMAFEAEFLSAGAGVNLGITFAKGHGLEFSYGIEAFLMSRLDVDEIGYYDPIYAAGPTLQFSRTSNTGWKMTTGITGGVSTNDGILGVLGEIGKTYHFGQNQWGTRLGVSSDLAVYNFALRHDTSINETTINAGLKFPNSFGMPVFTQPLLMDGRPLRTSENNNQRQNRAVINDLASKWADTAQDEYEAIFAFGNLAFELIQAGAPDELIEQALLSAEQEIEHAKFCDIQAKQLDDGFKLQPPKDIFRSQLTTQQENLNRLAMEGLIDGFQGEGVAAKSMLAGAKQTTSKDISQNLFKIANEETGHANLGANIAKWAVMQDQTGFVRSEVESIKKLDLGQLEEGYWESTSGFVKHNELLSISDQTREELDDEIDNILKN